jgi:hypothetical protein
MSISRRMEMSTEVGEICDSFTTAAGGVIWMIPEPLLCHGTSGAYLTDSSRHQKEICR